MKELYSAAGTLVKGRSKDPIVLLAKRSRSAFFYPSAYVMPGGLVSKGDIELAKQMKRVDEERFHGIPELAYRITFLREFFEETGILLVKGSRVGLSRDEIVYFRQKLVNHQVSFHEVLKVLGLSLNALPLEDLQYAGTRITPPFSTLKYVTRYYLYEITELPEVIPNYQEHEEIQWFQPSALLREYEALKAIIPPPTLQQLRSLKKWPVGTAVKKLIERDGSPFGVAVPIEMAPNIEVVPLRSNTLPPASTTNLVIFGGKEYVLIDPGARNDEWEHEKALLQRVTEEGRVCKGIILTHEHKDHYEGVKGVLKEINAPIMAHPVVQAKLDGRIKIDVLLQDNEEIMVRDDKGEPYHVVIFYTPGHTRGSISVYDPLREAVCVGDLISGLSTTIINPPEGNLRDYLQSLRKLRSMKLRMLIPGHGPIIMKPQEKIDYYLKHRLERHEAIRRALRKDPRCLMDLVRIVYTDVKEEYYPLAARSLLAHLILLREDGELPVERFQELTRNENNNVNC